MSRVAKLSSFEQFKPNLISQLPSLLLMALKVVTIMLWILRFGYNLFTMKSVMDAFNSLPSFHFRVMVRFLCSLTFVTPLKLRITHFSKRQMPDASRRNRGNCLEHWKRRLYSRCQISWPGGEILFYLEGIQQMNPIDMFYILLPLFQVGYSASQAALFVR